MGLPRFSWVDLGAAVAVLGAAAGVLWSPKLTGAVTKATGAMQPVEFSVDIKHTPSADPEALMERIQKRGRTSLVIRNQPHGSVAVKSVGRLKRQVALVFPDGQVRSVPDPNDDIFTNFDVRLVLEGEGRRTSSGVVVGNQALKIGSHVELEGPTYRIKGMVSGIQLEGL